MSRGEEKNERVVRLLAEQLGVSAEKVRSYLAEHGTLTLGADSLDVVELAMELEDEFPDKADQ